MAEGFRRIEQRLDKGQPLFEVFHDGIAAYKQHLLAEIPISLAAQLRSKWSERIRSDRQLRFPHRKILDCLLGKFDFQQNQFTEVHFSELVKESRVSKSTARIHLALLEQRGYIERRSDGYRIFFKIADSSHI